MPDLSPILAVIGALIPLECMQAGFMQRAMLGLLLLAPMTAAMGVQVINLRMAFFSDAISHSAFAGIALGALFSVHPHWSMPLLGVAVGIGIVAIGRHSMLSSDTVIGVFFAAVTAGGIALVSRDPSLARDTQMFLYGDILTIADVDLLQLAGLLILLSAFQVLAFNRILYICINPDLAEVHRVRVWAYQYVFAGLLALVVIFSVWAMGVLLVTAMLIVPAATARNLARSSGTMFWWAVGISVSSAVGGLLLSAHQSIRTATGATIILISFTWFLVSFVPVALRKEKAR
ncbi:MAG TPA: metal ABC transporter permease [Myxococcota bacterium]|nr:metal ABC transporter permease [Myxococcota bacterium]